MCVRKSNVPIYNLKKKKETTTTITVKAEKPSVNFPCTLPLIANGQQLQAIGDNNSAMPQQKQQQINLKIVVVIAPASPDFLYALCQCA